LVRSWDYIEEWRVLGLVDDITAKSPAVTGEDT